MGIQGAGPGGGILVLGKQTFQFLIFFGPAVLVRVKGIRQPAPTDVLGQDFLFFRGSVPVLIFQGLQSADGLDIASKLLFGPALAQMLVGDAEVSGRWGRNFRLRLVNMEPFDRDIIGQTIFVGGVKSYWLGGQCRHGWCVNFA